ncbi:hypothetical protein N8J89_03920 [Crossiella sp. CA-258035]|uniref:hypothetical protein n=1 Tax=Crossiella sp. CA-258035 TaxID=2981138 RepID=UPI0024BCD55F|nr:hypothetical protein [Crossiella sp. CA-258035]WHT20231.1 hypothetical protein N8J89_03920 [Crossiella sp. CA-258035]
MNRHQLGKHDRVRPLYPKQSLLSYILTCMDSWVDLLLVSTIVAAVGPTVLAVAAVGELVGDLLLGALGAVVLLAVFELLRRRPTRARRTSSRAGALVLATTSIGVMSGAAVLCGFVEGWA